jgi:hypothetical protein
MHVPPCHATKGRPRECHAQWWEGDHFFFAGRPCVMSALPPEADIAARLSDVRFVPKADIPHRSWHIQKACGRSRAR